MYNYPERKKTYFIIPTKWGDVKYLLEQADVETTLDYRNLHKTNKNDDVVEIFKIYMAKRDFLWSILTKSEVPPKNKIKGRLARRLVYTNVNLYEELLSKFLFKTRNSVYLKMPPASNNGNKRNVFTAGDEILSKMTGMPIDEINQRLTMEQKQRRNDKATYDYYESFKQGKRVNSLVRGNMPLDDSEKDLIAHIKKDREEQQRRKANLALNK